MAELDLERTLIDYGLRPKQAKVYLATLQVGSGPILKIAQQAGLARSTTEIVLNTLLDKGLVSSFKKKRVRYFSADDPHTIIGSLKEKTTIMERALPKFMAVYGSSKSRPTVRFYEGKPGMKIILEEILNEAKSLLSFASVEDLFATLENYPDFVKKRVELKIPVRVILRDSPKARERKVLGPQHLREVRLIPEHYDYHGLFYIWNDKIAMFSFGEDLSAILIESQELSQMQRASFNFMWDSLEPK